MTKAPEEGRIWEWRAFGPVSDSLARKVRTYPVRAGLADLRGEDVYFVPPHSDQNIKLRRYSSGWVLKFKFLLETRPGGFELYDESAEFAYHFPVSRATLKEAARLLGAKLPGKLSTGREVDQGDFESALAAASPSVVRVPVSKRRSQYRFDGGWLELAHAGFPKHNVGSISIHSPELEVVKKMRERLKPSSELESMNYLQACRRWS